MGYYRKGGKVFYVADGKAPAVSDKNADKKESKKSKK